MDNSAIVDNPPPTRVTSRRAGNDYGLSHVVPVRTRTRAKETGMDEYGTRAAEGGRTAPDMRRPPPGGRAGVVPTVRLGGGGARPG
ncbi:hypothetical protein SBRY_50027 [Actinacidiphila bryophytorum]|uniref:Uncharacterized protein n=1 Tax=Actinacidiphila bryophytorum TaxID=1436133 RepID=A0A9W4H3T0_9ACTN|nr:hypothetical protein SBRY_50027 [Actinacidiphila bryophytorum]